MNIISGVLQYPTPITLQELSAFEQGEDVEFSFTLTSLVSPSAWTTVKLAIVPYDYPVQKALVETPGVISDVSSSGSPYTATITFTVLSAATKQLGQGSASWQCWWADSGNVTVLGSGELGINQPLVTIP